MCEEMTDHRQYAPATARNRDFILDVLRDVLPTTGVILEIASGSGEHVVHFARNLPSLVFQPSDPEIAALLSASAWGRPRVTNVRAHIALDPSQFVWLRVGSFLELSARRGLAQSSLPFGRLKGLMVEEARRIARPTPD